MGCESSVPTAQQMDALESRVHQEYEPQYAELLQARATGQLTPSEYETQRARLDLNVSNKVDSLLWNRHALAQSSQKSLGLPTPDSPVANEPPGVGSLQGSLYSSSRLNGLGNQIQGNFMRDMGNNSFQSRGRAGSAHDPQ